MSTFRRLTLLSLGVAAAAAVALAQDTGIDPAKTGSFVLVNQLNEAPDGQYYCAEVVGWTVEEGTRLQMHTCKDRPVPAEDMEFTADYPNSGQIYVTQADLCVTMRNADAGSSLTVTPCSTTRDRRQMWISDETGQIHPASDASLCWVVSSVARCGNPECSNYKRTLTLETCADHATRFITWWIPGGSVGFH